jgi:predicted nucleotidyltransferase
MRLSITEIQSIKSVIEKYTTDYDLFLYGSRTNDKLTGGDIDLFLILPDIIYKSVVTKKHYLDAEISLKLNEQKIDLTILSNSSLSQNVFFQSTNKIKL